MRVDTIRVKRLGALRDFDLKFSDVDGPHFENLKVSILVGENGTGKTSALKFLSRAFYYPGEVYGREIDTDYEVSYTICGQRFLITKANNRYFSTPAQRPFKIIASSYEAFERFDKVSFNPDGQRPGYVYIGPHAERIRLPVLSLAATSMPIIQAYFGSTDRKTKPTHNLLRLIGYADEPLVQLYSAPRFRGQPLKRATIINWEREVLEQERWVPMPSGGERLNRLAVARLIDYHKKTRVHPGLPGGVSVFDPHQYPGGAVAWAHDVGLAADEGLFVVKTIWFSKGGEYFDMSHMSSGELSMFYRFFRLIGAMTDDSLVLIDEPETHLHPRWIQRYVLLIKEILGSFRAHIILATHSPLVAADVPKRCIVGMRVREDGRVEQYPVNDKTMGTSPQEILREVFQLKHYQGDMTRMTIDRIENLLNEGRLEDAMSLYDDLGDSDAKFQLFLKMRAVRDRNRQ